ncbi:MAG: helix-turn-helix transcriptional regulator [Lachnospiraceae bacterium]|nr:helix-turn-helix transcriptional regulator [Lachnospiraceae bacterium]
MTIGEKIKYVRKLYHMSSAELAERTGMHPVSIRKYESNKMVPQSAQIERLAAAFHLSPAIFSGLTDMRFDFQYSGDCLGMLIMLYTSGALIINGERDEKSILKKETVKFTVSPLLQKFLQFSEKDKALSFEDVNVLIKDNDTLDRFIFWEFMYNRRDELYDAYMEEETKENEEAFKQICNDYDEIEMNTFLQGRLRDIVM